MNSILCEEKAQISIEMIIILAAVIAIVLLIVGRLQKTSEKASKVIDSKSTKIFNEIEDI